MASSRRSASRPGERGAESLEFVACLSLLLMVVLLAGRGVALMRLQAVAEDDARALARLAAVCDGSRPATLASVDPANAAVPSGFSIERRGAVVAATVVLRPTTLIPLLEQLAWEPRATVVMAREPGCASG